jgi:hypothetical protein
MLESARKHHYTLIIDEVVDVFEDANVKPDDVMTLLRAGYIERTDLGFKVVASEYSDGRLKDLFMMLQHNQLVEVKNGKKLRLKRRFGLIGNCVSLRVNVRRLLKG